MVVEVSGCPGIPPGKSHDVAALAAVCMFGLVAASSRMSPSRGEGRGIGSPATCNVTPSLGHALGLPSDADVRNLPDVPVTAGAEPLEDYASWDNLILAPAGEGIRPVSSHRATTFLSAGIMTATE